ncbi:hypothetical protein C1I98_26305 [Spongiactinospora gelatinilytica]|uniref:Uncharacterized protein n=1 Tax=Spongiactinospora gelatinilytica TaxID=2666298 RepID=A0A2W2G9B5_9ACTN|nr:hypothetical protein C1I98_26305 [Spongiactinospora gelatinilytica]
MQAEAAANVVVYQCKYTGSTETQIVTIDVELQVPTSAVTGQQMTIGWRGAYTELALLAPEQELPADAKLYAYASIKGIDGLTSATGVGTLPPVGTDEQIQLPTSVVELKTTPNKAGTGTVQPAAINFGTKPTEPLIECEVQNETALSAAPLTIAGAGQNESPSPSPSPSPSESASETPTESATSSDEEAPEIGKTPIGGAATGAGGDAGPDGRTFVLVGLLVVFAASAGLVLRRRGNHAG